jgi:hypothetical protein
MMLAGSSFVLKGSPSLLTRPFLLRFGSVVSLLATGPLRVAALDPACTRGGPW